MSQTSTRYPPATGAVAALHDARFAAFLKLQAVAREIR
jgi:D-ribulokinase